MRGWTAGTGVKIVGNTVFPAHAGMDRFTVPDHQIQVEFSPRMRGWTALPRQNGERGRRFPRACGDGPIDGIAEVYPNSVFPAHAGMDRAGLVQDWVPSVFPAHAGMDRSGGSFPPPDGKFSPRMRGWTAKCHAACWFLPVFPAHAGMDRGVSMRSRGACSFSPRMRGWTAAGFFPA